MSLISDQIWSHGVYLKLGRLDAYRIVCSTRNAENILMNKWPTDTGDEHRQALEVCAEVMKGNRHPDEARQAFVLAAQKADLFVADAPRQFTLGMPTQDAKKMGASRSRRRRH